MGDRGNVVFPSEAGNVFLYTHWGGTKLPHVVKRALAQNTRWDDPSYLTRIVFQCMLEAGGASGPEDPYRWLSFGIGPELTDNEWPLLVLDCESKEARFCSVGEPIGPAHWTSSFEDYAKSCDAALTQAWETACGVAKRC